MDLLQAGCPTRVHLPLALLASSLVPPSHAQVKEDWRVPTFANRLVLDSQDNVCVDGFGPGVNFIADKYAPDGALLWSTTFGHPTINESVNWLTVDSQDAVVLTGHMAGATGGMLTVKFSGDGEVLWSDVQNVNSGEAYRVEVDAEDNVYVLGVTFDFADNWDLYLVKFAPDGQVLWNRQKSYAPGTIDLARALSVSPGGRVAITGQLGSNNFVTTVYDTDGVEQFTAAHLNGTGGPQDVLLAPDGTVYVCGMTSGNLGVVLRYDTDGTLLWETEIAGPDIWWARMNKLALDSEGNVLAAGYGNAPQSSFMDWLVAKLGPDGTTKWTRTHGNYETWDEWILAVTTGPSDEVYVAGGAGVPGCTFGMGIGTAAIRYDADGNIDWLHEASCSGSWPNSIALDSTGEVVLDTGPGEIIRLLQASWLALGTPLPGSLGAPHLAANGYLEGQQPVVVSLQNALPGTSGWHVVGNSVADLPILGGTLIPDPALVVPLTTDASGHATWTPLLPANLVAPLSLYVQSWLIDPSAPAGFSATNAVTKSLL